MLWFLVKVFFHHHQKWGINPATFAPLIRRLKKVVRIYEGDFNVVFTSDVVLRKLNRAYRGKDKSTDVLSFLYDNEAFGGVAGEIYISVPTARRQAKTLGHSLQEELNKLFVHGFLHLHGYDHEREKDYKKMRAIETKILGKQMT